MLYCLREKKPTSYTCHTVDKLELDMNFSRLVEMAVHEKKSLCGQQNSMISIQYASGTRG